MRVKLCTEINCPYCGREIKFKLEAAYFGSEEYNHLLNEGGCDGSFFVKYIARFEPETAAENVTGNSTIPEAGKM